MNRPTLLENGYKRYKQPNYEATLYQKSVADKKGVKYFINCYHYNNFKMDSWEFKLQTETKYGTVNTTLFNTELNIIEIEEFIEKIWINYGSNYYEEFSEVKNEE